MKKLILLVVFLITTVISLGEESKGILYKAINGNKTIYFYGILDIPYKKVESIHDKYRKYRFFMNTKKLSTLTPNISLFLI